MGHQIVPDQDNNDIILGRFIQDYSYSREKKELMVGTSKMDVFHISDGKLVVGEVKKSSRYKESARMQLAFYLMELKKRGVDAKGELRFPQEKYKESIVLNNEIEEKLQKTIKDILRILYLPAPPEPVKNIFCGKCAYNEFCWV